MEQSEVFLMQNWEHIEFLFSRINEIPGQTRDTDFSRVHYWALNGWYVYCTKQ
jgi:U3 small nucleolar RNA-associated protein 25